VTPLLFGVSQFTTGTQSFEEDVALLCETGIPCIEVCEAKLDARAPDAQLDILKQSGLRVSSVQPRLHSLFPDFPRPEPRSPKARMQSLRATIELFSRHFPGTTFVTISGAAPLGNYELASRTAIEEYKEIARIAAGHGVRLALEPLNPILMNVDTFLCSLRQALELIESVDEAAFGLFVDVWHIWEDAGAVEQIERAGTRIFGVHVNDWKTPRTFGDRHLPGSGEIPLVKLLKAIHATGYAGAYTLEIFSELDLDDSLWKDPRRTVIEGRDAFARVWEQVCD
jgi:sugar phosphate isomerase/epimerase